MNPLASPVVRIALGSIASVYLAPKIINKFVRVELNPIDEQINNASYIGITAAVTTLVFVALGMATGKSAAAAVAPGV